MDHSRSQALFALATELIPGGVNSPVRAFRAVGGEPVFIARAEGSRLFDVDGNAYIDYVGSWGPMLLGHNHPEVRAAVAEALADGASFGAPTAREVEMAQLVVETERAWQALGQVSYGPTAAEKKSIQFCRSLYIVQDLKVGDLLTRENVRHQRNVYHR